ncbi:MAG TPA: histidine kinase [Amycolatopsis sp.]|uniref:sensor histidine kinase n=1 Tax=Amycolatopsis sp. TaxID=37632 RepID=UPI002B4983FA|nr:histidine kinase [Amycolatopsis sp.]HKS43750.1 histidine kinase [Amycolatopsis sp.]
MTEGVASRRLAGLNRLRAWSRRHTLVVDAALTVLVLLLTGVRLGPDQRWPINAVLGILLVVPLALRRRCPLGVFGCVAAIAFAQWLTGRPVLGDLALLVGLYTVAAYCGRTRALIALGVLELGVVLAVIRWSGTEHWLQGFVFLSGMATAAFVLGRNVRTRRAYLASLEDRARRAEHERDQQAQLAAAAERARIAREMHDIVAHNLSVMIALADGAAFAARGNPDDAEAAARQVSATGRQALTEMHRLLGVLRGSDQEAMRVPQPGIEQLDELVAQVRGAGLPTSLTVVGEPFGLPPTAQLAIYRLVQEALTNVLKHADSPSEAKVTLRYRDPVVEIEVADDGRPGPSSAHVAGHGLGGMAERAAMFDGEVSAGPRSGGGWRVLARLAGGQTVGEGAA